MFIVNHFYALCVLLDVPQSLSNIYKLENKLYYSFNFDLENLICKKITALHSKKGYENGEICDLCLKERDVPCWLEEPPIDDLQVVVNIKSVSPNTNQVTISVCAEKQQVDSVVVKKCMLQYKFQFDNGCWLIIINANSCSEKGYVVLLRKAPYDSVKIVDFNYRETRCYEIIHNMDMDFTTKGKSIKDHFSMIPILIIKNNVQSITKSQISKNEVIQTSTHTILCNTSLSTISNATSVATTRILTTPQMTHLVTSTPLENSMFPHPSTNMSPITTTPTETYKPSGISQFLLTTILVNQVTKTSLVANIFPILTRPPVTTTPILSPTAITNSPLVTTIYPKPTTFQVIPTPVVISPPQVTSTSPGILAPQVTRKFQVTTTVTSILPNTKTKLLQETTTEIAIEITTESPNIKKESISFTTIIVLVTVPSFIVLCLISFGLYRFYITKKVGKFLFLEHVDNSPTLVTLRRTNSEV